MAKIKGWRKYDDTLAWESEKYGDRPGRIVRVIQYWKEDWQVVGQKERNGNFANLFGKSFSTKEEARRRAIRYLRSHPNG